MIIWCLLCQGALSDVVYHQSIGFGDCGSSWVPIPVHCAWCPPTVLACMPTLSSSPASIIPSYSLLPLGLCRNQHLSSVRQFPLGSRIVTSLVWLRLAAARRQPSSSHCWSGSPLSPKLTGGVSGHQLEWVFGWVEKVKVANEHLVFFLSM